MNSTYIEIIEWTIAAILMLCIIYLAHLIGDTFNFASIMVPCT